MGAPNSFDSKVLAELERLDPEEAKAYQEDLDAIEDFQAMEEMEGDSLALFLDDDLDDQIEDQEYEELGEHDPFESF